MTTSTTSRPPTTRAVRPTSVLSIAAALLVGLLLWTLLSQEEVPAAAGATQVTGPATGPGGGQLAPGTTVADDDLPGVERLEPDLREALTQATAAAAADGVELVLSSGWRSPAYQDRLQKEAVREHGSAKKAARWVASAHASAHVTGQAVDIGSYPAAEWLMLKGAAHGLCQTYANEPWHYELRPQAVQDGCPDMFDDPTADPRLDE